MTPIEQEFRNKTISEREQSVEWVAIPIDRANSLGILTDSERKISYLQPAGTPPAFRCP